jgi:hypothetical protein
MSEKKKLNWISIIGLIVIWNECFWLNAMTWLSAALFSTLMCAIVFIIILPIHLAVRHKL